MPFITNRQDFSKVNFLASENFQSFSVVVDSSFPGAVDGVVKAGTIFPANDATAEGILLHDVNIKNGENVGALIVGGYIIPERLPVAPDAAAITALTDIKFFRI